MLEKFAGYKTQIRVLEKKLKEMDHSKLSPAKVKEVTEAIQNLKSLVKEKEDKRIERKKKKEEAAASKPVETPKVEAVAQPAEVVKESSPAPTEVTKESTVEKFAVDSKVEPIRGTPGSWGTVIREAGVNGDPLIYVKWNEGHLKTAHGDYGAYYPSDLRLKVEAKSPTDYVPREQVYNLEADYKGKLSAMIKDLEEEIKTAYDKGEAVWAHRLEQKLSDAKKALEEKSEKEAAGVHEGWDVILNGKVINKVFYVPGVSADEVKRGLVEHDGFDPGITVRKEKRAEDENGSGGTNKLKVIDLTPAHDKDPQEKATGYGGDRSMGALVAPNSDENSLPLESSLDKDAKHTLKIKSLDDAMADCSEGDWHFSGTGARTKEEIEEQFKKHVHASLNKNSINITVAEKLFVVNPLAKTAENEYVYDVSLSNGDKFCKITSEAEMGQEHLSYAIEKAILNHKEASNKCAICNMEFKSWEEYDAHKKEKHGPKMAKLVSNLAFLKKGSFVSILNVDKTKKQVKFASLDGTLRGWAPIQKFAAFAAPETNLVPHENHQDEVLAESGHELLVSCPANSTNVIWRAVEAPPATPESLNDLESKKIVPHTKECNEANDRHVGPTEICICDSKKEAAKDCPDCHGNFVGKEDEKCPTCGRFAVEAHCGMPHGEKKEARGCDQCNAAMINGVFCHETGCPNKRKEREQEDMEMESSLNKDSHIRHEDGKWVIYSHDYKKKLGTYDTEEEAKKRLGQIEYFKHQGSLHPLSKKEAAEKLKRCDCGNLVYPNHKERYGHEYITPTESKKEAGAMDTKCEECGEPLGPEAFLSKWPVCGKCTKKRHEKAVGKRADQNISLEQQIQGFKDRMSAVTERLSNPPVKTAAETSEQAQEGEKVIATPELIESIERGIDLLEQRVGEEIAPEQQTKLEEMENLLWSVEDSLGLSHPLPEHERVEPEHATEVEKREDVEKESDMSNVPPPTPAPQGFRYAWEPINKEWIMVADPNATGTGTGGTY